MTFTASIHEPSARKASGLTGIQICGSAAALSLWALSANAVTVTLTDVMGEVGHTARVCGVVAWATYEVNFRAHPTFVTMVDPDQPNALHGLTAVIYETDRAKFGGAPEASLEGQRICVTGFVSFFRQRPECKPVRETRCPYHAMIATVPRSHFRGLCEGRPSPCNATRS